MRSVYYGGDILTMDNTPAPEAVLVEDGIIRQLGSASELLRLPGTEPHNLRGRTLMPAFLDPHSHLTACAQSFGLVQLGDVTDFDGLAKRLTDFVKQNSIPSGGWVTGFGYDQNFLAEKRHPDRDLLDRILPGHPVLLAHASGHMGVLSSAALRALGISAGTPDPPGGRIGRKEGSQEPDGYLEETAFTSSSAAVPKPDMETRLRQLRQAEDCYLRFGITTVQDGLTRPPEWELLRTAAESGRLRLDTVCYPDEKLCPELFSQNPQYQRQYHNRLKAGGYKIFLDGSPQGRTAWMSRPYADDPAYSGYGIYPDSEVTAFLIKALSENAQVLAHCNGDAACEQFIRCYEAALAETKLPSAIRPVMIHAQLVRKDQLERMAKLGMIASFFTAHSWYWGDIHRKNFGEKRASFISPAHAASDAGVCFTFHQDTPVILPDMLETVWCAVNRVTRSGHALGAGQRISVESALRAVTSNAAFQYFEEDRKGRIRPGMLADLVVLSENPLKTEPARLREIAVCETIREGETLYQI